MVIGCQVAALSAFSEEIFVGSKDIATATSIY